MLKKYLVFGIVLCGFSLIQSGCTTSRWENFPEFEVASFAVKKGDSAKFLAQENFLVKWTMLAAFPAKGLHEEYLSEEAVLCGKRNAPAGTKWYRYLPSEKMKFPGTVDFASLAAKNPVTEKRSVFYFCTTLKSDAAYNDLVMKTGSAGFMKVWINGLLVYSSENVKESFRSDRDKIKGIRFEKGFNRIVVKYMDNPKGSYKNHRLFSLRFTDADGHFSVVR